jgi:hypothetical protein
MYTPSSSGMGASLDPRDAAAACERWRRVSAAAIDTSRSAAGSGWLVASQSWETLTIGRRPVCSYCLASERSSSRLRKASGCSASRMCRGGSRSLRETPTLLPPPPPPPPPPSPPPPPRRAGLAAGLAAAAMVPLQL